MPLAPLSRTARLAARGLEAITATSLTPLVAAAHLRRASPERRGALLDRYLAVWARRMLHAGGAEVLLAHGQPPTGRGPRIVVANHRSMLDTPVMLHLFGGRFLAHDGLARLPVLGHAARVGGVVFVDREAPNSRVVAMRAMKRVLDGGDSLIVFPEGTTFLGDEVRPFFAGVFHLAPHAEVLPVGLAYDDAAAEFGDESLGAHAQRLASRARTRVAVAIGEPLPRAKRGEARGMAEAARAAVQALVARARAAHGR